MEEELFTLKWNNHHSAFLEVIRSLRTKNSHTDATLACEGKLVSVHKFVLSTCSNYFSDIFENVSCQNPVIILKDIEYKYLGFLLDYMYVGEVNVRQTELASLVSAAESLKIKGLAVPDEVAASFSNSKMGHSVTSDSHTSPKIRDDEKLSNPAHAPEFESGISGSDVECQSIKLEKEDATSFFVSSEEPHHYTDKLDSSRTSEYPSTNESANLEVTSNMEAAGFSEMLAENDSGHQYYDINESIVKTSDSAGKPSAGSCRFFEEDMQDDSFDSVLIPGSGNGFLSPSTLTSRAVESQYVAACRMSSSLKRFAHNRLKKKFSHFVSRKANLVRDKNAASVYVCPHCSYTCQDNSNFKRHVRTHTGEKPYHCPFCSFCAIHSSNLKTHIRAKHSRELINQSSSSSQFTLSLAANADVRNPQNGFECNDIPPSLPPSM